MENRSFDHVLGWMRRSRPDIDGLTGRESNFLTKRDAWAGTFESYFSLRKTPGTDCPEKLPEVVKSLRPHGPKEDEALSSFQVELIQLISQLNGDHAVDTYPHIGMSMNVDQASKYTQDTVARFLEAGRNTLRAGVNASSLLTIRPSLAALRSI